MATDLALGRALPCNDQVAGLVAVYFFNFAAPAIDDIAVSATNDITSLDAVSAYKYELKGPNTLVTTFNPSQENGTSFYTQVLTLQLINIPQTLEAELIKMATNRLRIVVQDRNGNAFLCGYREGCNLTSGDMQTGGAHGDFVGANLVFTANEDRLPYRLNGATKTNPFAGMTETVTVVST